MLKMALISYVNSAKAVWSIVAHPLEIFSKKGKKLRDYRIFGNSVQDGVPTPEAPIEVQSVGELTTKNLLDQTIWSDIFNYTDEGYFISNTLITDAGSTRDFELEPGSYTLSYSVKCPVGKNYRIGFFLEDGNRQITYLTSTGEWIERIEKLSFSKKVVGIFWGYGSRSDEVCFKNVQIEYGDTATEYEPYQKYKVPVTARGKNLFDKTTSIAESYIDDANGEFKISTYLKYYSSDYIEVLPNKTIYVTLQNAGNWGAFYDENKVFISGYRYGKKIVPSNAKYLRITVIPAYLDTMQVEYSDTPTEYEPYVEPQTHNLYLNEPLRKLGEYADYIDFEKGVVVRKIRERTIGSVSWDKYSNSSEYNTGALLYRYEHPISDKRLLVGGWSTIGNLLCNGLKHTSYNGGGVVDKSISERPYETGQRSLRILTSEYDTAASMKEAFGDFKVYYILDDAYITEEKVTLPALPTFKGTTVYEVQTSTEPSGMQACYYE